MKRAEETRQAIEQDFMILTHQLQAPLSSAIASLKLMGRQSSAEGIKQRIGYVEAIIEDALSICYGLFTSFADEVGRRASTTADNIDAMEELKKLTKRLQVTNTRDDLHFVFSAEQGFPVLRVDKNILSSVLYSLVHNAMKYADRHSKVSLSCGIDNNSRDAILSVKSIGEPIQPEERELIFEKYKRGAHIERTGRFHSGSGLGLWVAKKLMCSIGGDVTVNLSRDDPRVSEFVVHVPIN